MPAAARGADRGDPRDPAQDHARREERRGPRARGRVGGLTPPSELVRRIREEIAREGPISFERFMERALYEPGLGYYATSASRIGREGDFYTAADVGPAFGRCVARQVVEIDRRLGPFAPFHLTEFAAGRGWLARDLIDALGELDPGLAGRLRYRMVDRSPAMRAEAARRVPEALVLAPDDLPEAGLDGCAIAVELFDALPVRRLRRREGRLVEVRVDADAAGRLTEVERPASVEAQAWARRYGAAAEEGMEAEACPALAAQLATMARHLGRGLMLVFDYGDRAERLYTAERGRGTLLAYHRHQTSEAYLERVGEQDLTAHVNFTALEVEAERLGLRPAGLTTQDRFLIANGILRDFEQATLEQARDPARVKARLQAMRLIHPGGMGRVFKVLGLASGPGEPPALDGFADPFAPPR